MSREIKFRVWDSHTGKMVDTDRWGNDLVMDMDGELKWYKEREYQGGSLDISGTASLVLMQYTGLKDKEGREIYEGDVVAVDGIFDPETGQTDTEVRVVQYIGPSVAYVEYRKGIPHDVLFVHDVMGGGVEHDDISEVIGNIHENPELLK